MESSGIFCTVARVDESHDSAMADTAGASGVPGCPSLPARLALPSGSVKMYAETQSKNITPPGVDHALACLTIHAACLITVRVGSLHAAKTEWVCGPGPCSGSPAPERHCASRPRSSQQWHPCTPRFPHDTLEQQHAPAYERTPSPEAVTLGFRDGSVASGHTFGMLHTSSTEIMTMGFAAAPPACPLSTE